MKKDIKWHGTCKCKCRLDVNVRNNNQRQNKDKYRCEYKDLIDKGSSGEGFFWNPSNYDCECDKSCDVGGYLDYKNCKYRNKLNNKLVEKCSENIDVNEMIYNNYGKVCNSCIIYNILFIIAF